jgi:aspartate-semialdehyde dehydrogenase
MLHRVAIVGATGLVGETLTRVLEERRFPLASVRAFATMKSEGETVRVGRLEARVEALDPAHPDLELFREVDLAFFAAGDAVSAAFAREIARRGTVVIDKSGVHRLDAGVPLVVPEVNVWSIGGARLVANPNCSTIPLALALAPIEKAFGLAWASVATYQSVSGAGRDALAEFEGQLRGDEHVSALPRRIAGNVIPEVGGFDVQGDTVEELKIAAELRKILQRPDLPVSATAVRVPVAVGHSEALAFGTVRQASREEIEEALRGMAGLTVADGAAYATALDVAGTDNVVVSRLRPDGAHANAWLCWIVSDNLRKGAATNAVQIAEHILDPVRVSA